MINPLQYYKILGRPVGIWAGLIAIVLELVGHLALISVLYVGWSSMIVIAPLFILAMIQLIRRRFSGMVIGIAFLILGLYAGLMMMVLGYYACWCYVIAWWLVSFFGMAGLVSNRRWYDERLLRFP